MALYGEELVEVGGHRLTLAIDFSVIDFAEHLTGKEMPEIMTELGGSPPLGMLAKLLTALLRRHHPELSPAMAAGLLMEHREPVGQAIGNLLRRAMNVGPSEPSKGEPVKWSVRAFLIEWIALGGTDDRFWAQTPRSYVACMEGMARAATRQVDLSISTGWHAAMFALSGYGGGLKNKKLSDFLSTAKASPRSKNAEGIAFFMALRARGVPVEITRH